MDTTPTAAPRAPDTLLILFGVALLCALLSWLIPPGSFEVVAGEGKQRTITVESFRWATDPGQQGVVLFARDGAGLGVLNLPFEGLVAGDRNGTTVGIAAFLLVLGGAFGMIMRSGALDRALMSLIGRYQAQPTVLFPLLFVVFSLGGAVFGMGEETIPFVLLLAPIAVRMGFDSISVVLCTFVATQVGFGASWMNPFSVAIAQAIAGLEPLSGAGLRGAAWATFTALGAAFTWWHARRVYRDPRLSPSYATDRSFLAGEVHAASVESMRRGDGAVLLLLLAAMVWVIWGVVVHQYYLAELAAQFFALGVAVAIVTVHVQRLANWNDMAEAFRRGAEQMVGVVLVIALAKALMLALGGADPAKPGALNTILYGAAVTLDGLPAAVSAWLMLLFQSALNFLVPSGSGQAALTMPLTAPLSDLIGVSRQVAVLAFQYGDGFTNLLVPTSAVLMGVLGAARISWLVWARFAVWLVAGLFAVASAVVLLAVAIGWQ